MKHFSLIFLSVALCSPLLAAARIDFDRESLLFRGKAVTESPTEDNEMVVWVGRIDDKNARHNQHQHDLKFSKKDDGRSFDLDSEGLTNLHHDTEKNYLVEIVAVKTPRFLFWGNDLKVRSFRVLEELEAVPHVNSNESPLREGIRLMDRI
ncbi:MAG: hypothetical protein SGJ18_00830 [Pseudomonadota bacterium]|mgnify:CR=1 FL=1|nr:hypothetical protein [Pseudomonadota bacterium]